MVKQVRLGKSDVNVFPIALGTNAVGGHNWFCCKVKNHVIFILKNEK